MKKELSKIIIVIGFIVAVVGTIVDALNFGTFTTISALEIAGILALGFLFAKNNTLNIIGYALAAYVGAISIGVIMNANDMYVLAIGGIIYFVGAVIWFIPQLLKFFGFVKGGKQSSSSDISTILNKYKEMEKEKIITEEEFTSLKNKALQVNEKEVFNFEDLKKWKKLLDQSIITEEEFAQLKAKVLI